MSSPCQDIPGNRGEASQWPSCWLYRAQDPYVWLGLSFWHPRLGGGGLHVPKSGCPGCLPNSCFAKKTEHRGGLRLNRGRADPKPKGKRSQSRGGGGGSQGLAPIALEVSIDELHLGTSPASTAPEVFPSTLAVHPPSSSSRCVGRPFLVTVDSGSALGWSPGKTGWS